MKICEYVSEIERITILHKRLQKDIEDFINISYKDKMMTFYNLIFLNKFNNVFPVSLLEEGSFGKSKWNCSTDIINSLYKQRLSFIINYKDYKFEIKYLIDSSRDSIEAINFDCGDIYGELIIKNSIDFKKDNLKEIMEEKYQLILDKFEEMIQKDKMLKNNINFMKELVGIEIS